MPRQTTRVVGTQRVAHVRLRCTTCGGAIARRQTYRADEWQSPLRSEVLTSCICAECQAEGL